MSGLAWLTQLLEVLAGISLAPLLLGWVNQCRAWLQNRRGAEPAAALPRHPQAVAQGCGDRARTRRALFRAAPYVVFGAMVAAAAIIPSMGTGLPFTTAADAIALVGLFATARVFMSLAAMDIGTAFGTLGARREMMVGFLAEPALLMVHLRGLADLGDDGAAGDRRAPRDAGARAVPEPGLHRGGVHDGAAGRERAHPGRQSRPRTSSSR